MTAHSPRYHPMGVDACGAVPLGDVLRTCVGRSIDGVAVALGDARRRFGVIETTDDRAARVMTIEGELGEGPGWDSLRSGSLAVMHCNDAESRRRWPVFGQEMIRLGFATVVGCPLVVGRSVIGVQLGVSSSDDIEIADLRTFEAAATTMARFVLDDVGAADRAVDSLVHQASGLVAVQQSVTPEAALLMLRAQAFVDGVALATIAAQVMSRHERSVMRASGS